MQERVITAGLRPRTRGRTAGTRFDQFVMLDDTKCGSSNLVIAARGDPGVGDVRPGIAVHGEQSLAGDASARSCGTQNSCCTNLRSVLEILFVFERRMQVEKLQVNINSSVRRL